MFVSAHIEVDLDLLCVHVSNVEQNDRAARILPWAEKNCTKLFFYFVKPPSLLINFGTRVLL